MSEYMIKAYVKKEIKHYIESVAGYHNISVSKLIAIALNQPAVYQMLVTEFKTNISDNPYDN